MVTEPTNTPQKPSFAERMIAAGEKMEGAGKATSHAGGSITVFVIALFVVLVLGLLLYAVAC
jgi:hypothetical protein